MIPYLLKLPRWVHAVWWSLWTPPPWTSFQPPATTLWIRRLASAVPCLMLERWYSSSSLTGLRKRVPSGWNRYTVEATSRGSTGWSMVGVTVMVVSRGTAPAGTSSVTLPWNTKVPPALPITAA